MKKKMVSLIAVLALMFCFQPAYASEQQEIISSADYASAYQMTVSFQANGGTGVMTEAVLMSDEASSLPKNTFARTDFTFTGWNTKANGHGTAIADQASVSQLIAATGKKKITLYAQWKINPPKILSLKAEKGPGALKISYSGVASASSYEVQYSLKNNFCKPVTVPVKKGGTSAVITDFVPGKVNYVRMRSYHSETESYSDWSNILKKKTKKGSTIVNTKSDKAIEADIKLSGSGTGYHAKLVIGTQYSAVSFGIQYDSYAVAPYTGKTMALIENVASNNPGGQKYIRPKNKSLKRGKTYHMMITVDKKGKGAVYLDYKKIGSFSNSGLKKGPAYLRIEGCGRLNGDQVKAEFKNIKCKMGKTYDPSRVWNQHVFHLNKGLKNKTKKNGAILLSGKIKGLPAGDDWDSQYESVSEIIQFY